MEQEFKDRQTEAAAEGTAAHALAEYKLRRALHQQAERPVSPCDSIEMDEHTEDYAQFVQEMIAEAKRLCADPVVNIEQRLDFSDYVPGGFGTGDCVIVADRRLHIIDFKYGQGVLVEAERNPQLMLYALGALHVYDALYDVDEVSMTIYQPRRANVSTWTLSVDALRAWAENELRPRAQLAYSGEGEYCPGAWWHVLPGGGQMPGARRGEAPPGAVRVRTAAGAHRRRDSGHTGQAGRPRPLGD